MKSSNIGGQAVMEGIMMMNKDRYSVAVRRPDGEIEVKVEQHKPLTKHKELLKVPILRGVFSFADSMIVGMSSLMYSASFYEDEEEEKKKPATKEEEEQQKAKKEKTDRLMMYGTVTFSVVIAVVLFLMVPYFLSELLHKAGAGTTLTAVAEAFVRVALFLGYLAAISRMEDIQRVFMYHGAEHKCINCVEHGLELNVENVLKSSREHKRCGTSFLLFVMLVSIVLFLFIRVQNPLLRLGLRILLIPVIAGISYELIRLAGRSDNFLVRIISAPGMWLQRLTTKEPDDSMIEVAIASVEAVFDWKAYLKETFGYDVEDWEKQDAAAKAQEAEDAEAADGMEAVMLCRQNPDLYSIIIMDVMMPVMGGLEAAKNIRKMDRPDAKTVAMIAMSANAFHDDVEQSLAAGMNVHMAKPLDFDKLLATIKEYCDKN